MRWLILESRAQYFAIGYEVGLAEGARRQILAWLASGILTLEEAQRLEGQMQRIEHGMVLSFFPPDVLFAVGVIPKFLSQSGMIAS